MKAYPSEGFVYLLLRYAVISYVREANISKGFVYLLACCQSFVRCARADGLEVDDGDCHICLKVDGTKTSHAARGCRCLEIAKGMRNGQAGQS
jgi:hypothetical protein